MADQTSQPGQFCWNELATPDVSKSKTFYSSLFGWEYADHDMGEFTYTMFKSGDNDIGGMYQIQPDKLDKIPPNWMSYVFVESIDDTLKNVESLGGTIVQPNTSIGDFGLMAVIKDPSGAIVALWQKS